MDLKTIRHSSDMFTVYNDRKELVTYESDLRANGNLMHVSTDRVYDDACDEGFTMVSTKTGEEAVFALCETARGDEGDVLCWRYEPTRDTVRRLPQLRWWKAVLIND